MPGWVGVDLEVVPGGSSMCGPKHPSAETHHVIMG